MYKYDDFFVPKDDDYGYYDEYMMRDMDMNMDDMDRRRRRNLLSIRIDEYYLYGDDTIKNRLDGRDRYKMKQKEIFMNDNDYKIMIELGLMDDQGNWIISKRENDWKFLRDFKHDVLHEDDEEEEHPVLVDGYINENENIIMNDHNKNKQLGKMKQIEMEKLHAKDLMDIQRKLENIFDKNYMDLFPWIMNDLSLYIFYEKNMNNMELGSNNRRRLLDTFGDSLRYMTRILNKHFGVDTRYLCINAKGIMYIGISFKCEGNNWCIGSIYLDKNNIENKYRLVGNNNIINIQQNYSKYGDVIQTIITGLICVCITINKV